MQESALMRRVEVIVRGALPPRKDGANSMWGKSVEFERLVALRRAALDKFGSDGLGTASLLPVHNMT